jgi:hypothetical protein
VKREVVLSIIRHQRVGLKLTWLQFPSRGRGEDERILLMLSFITGKPRQGKCDTQRPGD